MGNWNEVWVNSNGVCNQLCELLWADNPPTASFIGLKE